MLLQDQEAGVHSESEQTVDKMVCVHPFIGCKTNQKGPHMSDVED